MEMHYFNSLFLPPSSPWRISSKLSPKPFFSARADFSKAFSVNAPAPSSLNPSADVEESITAAATAPKPKPKPTPSSSSAAGASGRNCGVRRRVSDAQFRDNWLTSLSSPFRPDQDHKLPSGASQWVLGVDPDLSGALALLKTDPSGHYTAQVFDTPHLQVLVGKRIRRRLDAKSIVQLLQTLKIPIGTTAYVEQSNPYPQDGKQGWWSGGFGYGLWIGVLVASGFNVVPISTLSWKNEFELSGGLSNKDDSRKLASMMFPSLNELFKRKKDHGRAEALLIAAYGKGLKLANYYSLTL